MSPTAYALLGFAAWTIAMLVALGLLRSAISLRGKKPNSFKPSGEDLPGLPYRLTRVHANCYENLPAAAAIMLYAMVSQQTSITDPLAFVFIGARIAQSVTHILSTSNPMVFIRFGFFIAQQSILVVWLLRLSGLIHA